MDLWRELSGLVLDAAAVLPFRARKVPDAMRRGIEARIAQARGAEKPIRVLAKEKRTASVFIYDVIGDPWDGTTAKKFQRDLAALGELDRIDIFINSPGGSVFDGITIHNVLARNRARKVVVVDGLAASIASFVAMAGDEIRMAENAMMMIHDPWAIAIGGPADMRKMADTLDEIRDSMLATYARRTGMDADAVAALMRDETWMGAAEAVEMGFADEAVEPVDAAALARFDLSAFTNVPECLVAAGASPASPTSSAPAAPPPAAAENSVPADPADEDRLRALAARRAKATRALTNSRRATA
jgi:ATP-dependent Clp endopeptidase proteolytic subunit ClpP